MNKLIFRLNHLPDLTIQTYTSCYGADVRAKVFDRQQDFLTLLHELGQYGSSDGNGSVMSLRFVYFPTQGAKAPLAIYLLINNQAGMDNEKLKATLLRSPLSEFYSSWQLVTDAEEIKLALGEKDYQCCVELIKQEAVRWPMFKREERSRLEQAEAGQGGMSPYEVRELYDDMHKNAFYYVPLYLVHPFEAVSDSDMLFLDRYLQAFDEPLMIEISLRATQATDSEVLAVERMLNHLEKVKNFSVKEKGLEQRFSLRNEQQDFTAEAVADIFEECHEALLNERHFEFAIKVWGDDLDTATVIADEIGINCNANGKYRKLVLKADNPDFVRSLNATRQVCLAADIRWPEYWDDSWSQVFTETDYYSFNETDKEFNVEKRQVFPFLYNLQRFSRLSRLKDIASFFRLPVPSVDPLFTCYKETEIYQQKDSEADSEILLGVDACKPIIQCRLELEQLKKHMFISGVPGSGKTTAIFNQLVQLHQLDVPFLVFEPAKTEYRLLKRLRHAEKDVINHKGEALGEVLRVYTLGQEHISPLRFNPFEFPQGITLNEHVSSLEACFKGALPISTGPLPALINEAVDECYIHHGWSGTSVNDGSRLYPTLSELYDEIQAVFARKNYSGDVRGDLQTAIEVRIGSLLKRSIGRIFDTQISNPSIETLMTTPCIIELDALNEEQSNLMIMFLLSQIREYVRATRRSGAALEHVIVLEEAHNIIGKAEESGEEGGNSKLEATKYITRFLAEVRALGEGIIIADQLPSAVAPEVIKNTNIKLAHRMVSGDDREQLGMTMLLEAGQFDDMARLPPGEAFLYKEGMYKPLRIRGEYIAAKNKYPIFATSPPDSFELVELLKQQNWHQNGIIKILKVIVKTIGEEVEKLQSNANTLLDSIKEQMLTEQVGLSQLKALLISVGDAEQQLEEQGEYAMRVWKDSIVTYALTDCSREQFTQSEEFYIFQDIPQQQKLVLGKLFEFKQELVSIIQVIITDNEV